MSNPKKQIRNIYGYCRVSTTEQAENGISIDTQQELISEFVREKFNRVFMRLPCGRRSS